MDPWEVVKWVAIFRLIIPGALFRLCGGRVENLGDLQPLAVKAGLNGVMMGNFLTTLGSEPEWDRQMFEELGLNVARQDDNGANPRPDNRSGRLEGDTPATPIDELIDRVRSEPIDEVLGDPARARARCRCSSRGRLCLVAFTLGTRGGLSVMHTFPADGEYVFKLLLHSGPTGDLFGTPVQGEQIEVSINGERKALLTIADAASAPATDDRPAHNDSPLGVVLGVAYRHCGSRDNRAMSFLSSTPTRSMGNGGPRRSRA